MTLDAGQFKDPMIVLQQKQEAQLRKVAACGDCVNARMVFRNDPRCTIKFQSFGYRCQFYRTAEK